MNRRTKELLAENNALERGLNEENGKILTDIVVYLRTAPVSEYQQELVRRDITHMMLDGQARGASMQEVLGDDYQAFCDQVLDALPPMSMLSRVLSAAGNLCYYLAILAAIWLAFELAPNLLVRAGLYVRITVGDVLGGAAIVAAASLIVFWICRFSFQEDGPRLKILVGSTLLLCFACLVASFFLQIVLLELHALVVLVGILLLFGLHKLLEETVPA